VFFLCQDMIYEGRILNWQNFLELKLDKSEWEESLSIAIDIYKGNNKMFGGLN